MALWQYLTFIPCCETESLGKMREIPPADPQRIAQLGAAYQFPAGKWRGSLSITFLRRWIPNSSQLYSIGSTSKRLGLILNRSVGCQATKQVGNVEIRGSHCIFTIFIEAGTSGHATTCTSLFCTLFESSFMIHHSA